MATDTELKELTAFAEDGTRIVSPNFAMTLFLGDDFTKIPDQVLALFARLLDLVGKGVLKFYENDSMTRASGIKPATFDLLEGWVRPPHGKAREMIRLHLQDGASYADTADHLLSFCGVEDGMTGHGLHANSVRLAVPLERVRADPDVFFDTLVKAVGDFPLISGLAGGNIERSDYHTAEADPIAWRIGMETPGFDIGREVDDRLAVCRDGIKGVNWITFLSRALVDEVGGIEALKPTLIAEGAEIADLPSGGVAIRVARAPLLCRSMEEFQIYSALFAALEPLMIPTLNRFGSFSLPGGNHIENSDAWLMRLKGRQS